MEHATTLPAGRNLQSQISVWKGLLACGVLSSAFYVAADLLASLQWYEGYNYADQVYSELLATGSPVRPLMLGGAVIYNLLVAAFAVGVWSSAGRTRFGRVTGAMLLAFAFFSMVTPLFFQMDMRGAEGTPRGALHGPLTAVGSLFTLLSMGFGAALFGKRFRYYSYGTIAVLIGFGAWTSLYIPQLVAGQSTPWMGLLERVNIYATMLWVAALSIALLRSETGPDTSRRQAAHARKAGPEISGSVKPGFEAVREAFVENFERRNELGAACCVCRQGEKVVDLWGGVRNEATGEPWEEGTMVLVFSTTKGISALTMALAHSRGLFEYDERVSRYWPEFAQQGKERITVRQLLSHQAGLFALDDPVGRDVIADLDKLAVVLARQKPAWEPGTRQAYHALTLGFYQGELLRRVDPRHRSLGQYFQDEIATPLGLDFYIRLPEEVPNSMLASLKPANMARAFTTVPISFTLAAIYPRSNIRRALWASLMPLDPERVYARGLEIPSGGGVGTARAIAQLYGEFAAGGHTLGLRGETLKQLMAPAVPPLHGFYDYGLKVEVPFSLGFSKPNAGNPFGHPESFGTPGLGGSFGFADPEAGIGYGYVTNGMGTYLIDPRDEALRAAMYRSIGDPNPYLKGTPAAIPT